MYSFLLFECDGRKVQPHHPLLVSGALTLTFRLYRWHEVRVKSSLKDLLYMVHVWSTIFLLFCRSPMWGERGWLRPQSRLLWAALQKRGTVCWRRGPLHLLLSSRVRWGTLRGRRQWMPVWTLQCCWQPRLHRAGQWLSVSLSPRIHRYVHLTCSNWWYTSRAIFCC